MKGIFAVALAATLSASTAFAQIGIGLMVSATGPTSAIGIPQRNTGDILPQDDRRRERRVQIARGRR